MKPSDFSAPLLRLQESPPNPLGSRVLWILFLMLVALTVWAFVGRLDVVAVATGKLVPKSYVKIVQPAEAGIVKEILVREGETVRAGQVLMRMDALMTEADETSIAVDLERKQLTLERIDAELSGASFDAESRSSTALVREISAQYRANRAALEAALAEEKARFLKAKHELSAAEEIRKKLVDTLPHYRKQENAFEELLREGYVASSEVSDKRRERIEKEQELHAQESMIESARANIQQSEKKMTQIESDYRRQLYVERNEIEGQADKLVQELAKQTYRKGLMDLKAPQDCTVKDLATHTIGTVVQPGTVLLTLVPKEEFLRAEVWVSNEDIGFVRQGQAVKLKFAAFPFQKYGMIEGTVEQVSVDAVDNLASGGGDAVQKAQPLAYRTLVTLHAMQLETDGNVLPLVAGMQTSAEIRLGKRTVLEYLLSPVWKAWHEAGRER